MLHEIGHVLLGQWEYPLYGNEEVADEFATVLMVMFGQAERARVEAEHFATRSPDEEPERKRDRDDRHPLSVQRARNIMNWLEDPNLLLHCLPGGTLTPQPGNLALGQDLFGHFSHTDLTPFGTVGTGQIRFTGQTRQMVE